MGSLPNNDNELFQNSINYLHAISELNHNPPALKCLYLTKASLMELKKYVDAPSVIKTTVRCQRCCMNIGNGCASYKIKPQEKKSKFARKLLLKSKQDKPMTKYQRKYFQRMSKINGNQLVITCKFCKKDFFIKLEKPKRLKFQEAIALSKKRRRKYKKDKFCGLDQQVVLSLTPETVRNLETSDFIPLEGNKKSSRVKLSKKIDQNIVKETVAEVVTKKSIKESEKKLKKKNKLKAFLDASGSSKTISSSNLKHFLQSL